MRQMTVKVFKKGKRQAHFEFKGYHADNLVEAIVGHLPASEQEAVKPILSKNLNAFEKRILPINSMGMDIGGRRFRVSEGA